MPFASTPSLHRSASLQDGSNGQSVEEAKNMHLVKVTAGLSVSKKRLWKSSESPIRSKSKIPYT